MNLGLGATPEMIVKLHIYAYGKNGIDCAGFKHISYVDLEGPYVQRQTLYS